MKKILSNKYLFIMLILSMSFSQFSRADNTAGSSSGGSAMTIIGEGITGAMGVYMATQCSCPHGNCVACFLAAQCAMQLASSLSSQGSMGNVTSAYQADGYSVPGGTGDPNSVTGTSGAGTGTDGSSGSGYNAANNAQTANTGALANLQKIQTALSNAGVKTDPTTGTVTLPNGMSLPASSTPDSLKSAGLDSSQVDSTLADEKKMESSLLAKAGAGAGGASAFGGYQSGGGGSRGANAVNPNASNDDAMNKYLASLNGKNRKPGSIKQGVAGLSRKLGSESIGVKGDNIFEMVNRRYQAQAKQNAFITGK